MKCTLHPYQREDTNKLTSQPSTALFLDCGLGKTLITLTAVSELTADLDCKGVLIVAPLNVMFMTWPLEIQKWGHTKWLSFSLLHGKDRLSKLEDKVSIHLVNYEGLKDLGHWLNRRTVDEWPFDTVVWDELTKMKCHTTKRFKLWKKIVPKFKRRIGLTGTPTPNGLLDLYAQILMVDGGEALGTSYTRYRDTYFHQIDYLGFKAGIPGMGKIRDIFGRVIIARMFDDSL